MDPNLTAKFGLPPNRRLPPAVVLGTHFVICTAILATVQPPFVTTGYERLCMHRVTAVATLATLLAGVLGCLETPPVDLFRNAVEMMHSTVRHTMSTCGPVA